MVRIPPIAFNTAQIPIDTSRDNLNVISEVGKAVSNIGRGVQLADRTRLQEQAFKRKEAQDMERIKLQRDKRNASAYMPRARTDFLLQHKDLELSLENEKDQNKKLQMYAEGFDKITQGFKENAPNDLARSMIDEQAEKARLNFGTKFLESNARQLQAERITDLEQSNEQIISMTRQGMDYQEALNIAQENMRDASSYLSPSEVKEKSLDLEQSIKANQLDSLLESEDLLSISGLLSDEKFTKNLPAKTIDKVRLETKKIKENNKAMMVNDPAGFTERLARIEGRTPDFNDAIALQEQQGLSETVMSVIGKEQSQSLVDRMLKVSSPVEMQIFVKEINDTYGRYSNNAFRDLREAGLPKSYSFIGNLDPIGDAQEMAVMFDVINAGEKQIKENSKARLSADNMSMSEYQQKFFEETRDFDEILLRQGATQKTLNDWKNNTYLMALSHYANNGDVGQSLSLISELPFKQYQQQNMNYQLAEINGVPSRIPSRYDVSAIEDGLNSISERDNIFVPTMSAEIKKIVGLGAKDQGYWALNAKGDGMIFRNENDFTPYLSDEGKFIEYSFDEILKENKKLIKKQEEISKEIDKALVM